ncbi:DUF4468 domain-containing protein [Leptospira terpstrae]|uniref:DUF4468 domain-containing protein n=1 Tax=Leptospira terpstrae TaxID=293075 RepID=UPI000586FC64|nr:DUF4468 domain-containing protein [Leptospira terpstrae]
MKTKNRISKYIIFLFIFSCATLPREKRIVTSVYDTNADKNSAFDRANNWLIKSIGNANLAVQLREKEKGRIISNGSLNCRELNGMTYGIAEKQKIDFTFDFTAKDNKVRIVFGDITHTSIAGNGMTYNLGPTSESQINEIDKTCFEPIKKELLDAINGKSAIFIPDDF